MSSIDENREVVRRIWEGMVNDGNLDLAYELVDEKYVYQGPGGYITRGPEGFKRLIAAIRSAIHNIRVSVAGYIAEGDVVASWWTIKGSDRETGHPIDFFGTTITRVAGGKMIEDWESWDRLDIAGQLASNWLQKKIIGAISKQFKKVQP